MKEPPNYIKKIRKYLKEKIPDFEPSKYKEMAEEIKKGLLEEESRFIFVLRGLKVLLLGDWKTKEQRKQLEDIQNYLYSKGRIYSKTIDHYYDTRKRKKLSQETVLEYCCRKHQLVVFIDGEGGGTITEQNYLRRTYPFHSRIIFFIKEKKFEKLKNNPEEYIGDFPTIIPYKKEALKDTILTYSRFRLYRLARIIREQQKVRRGLSSPNYMSMSRRLSKLNIVERYLKIKKKGKNENTNSRT